MQKLKFIKSAVKLSDFPEDHKPEVAFAGRSNAGKSSVINCLARSKVAMVSGTAGKTRLLNLFDHKEGYRIVDMPGYGYAARSGSEVKTWKKMVETFLLHRPNLKAIVLIMDIRREWDEEEEMILKLAENKGFRLAVILNKSDKISKSAVNAKKAEILRDVSPEFCLPFSAFNKSGVTELENQLFDWLRSTKSRGDVTT